METNIDAMPHPLVDALIRAMSSAADGGYAFTPAVLDTFIGACLDERFDGPELMAIWYSGTRAAAALQQAGYDRAADELTEAISPVLWRLHVIAHEDVSKVKKREDDARTVAKSINLGMSPEPVGLDPPRGVGVSRSPRQRK